MVGQHRNDQSRTMHGRGLRRRRSATRGERHALSAAPLGLTTRLGPCDDHIYRTAPAARTHEPIAPIENAGAGAILPGHLGGVGLDLVAARLTPHDESHASRSRVAERHRRPGLRFHESRVLIAEIDIFT